MTFIDKIKLLWKVKGTAEDIQKEATRMNGTKPGYKTTEFWLQVALQMGNLWGAVSGFVPPKYSVIIAAVGAAVYNIGQIILKTVTTVQNAKADSTTVTTSQPVTTITTPA